MVLSVVIPVFNEENTILEVISEVQKTPYTKEIIVANDGSTDRTGEVLKNLKGKENITVVTLEKNTGKGGALREAFRHVKGEIVIIQDADMEYSPGDYPKLLGPIIAGNADVVYGSRFLGEPHRVLYFWHYAGNKFLTLLSNMMTNLNLNDMETGFKAFRSSCLKGLRIRSNRFGFEPEITAKFAKRKYRIFETSISYSGRTYAQGKKITWVDGLKAVFLIFWFRFFD